MDSVIERGFPGAVYLVSERAVPEEGEIMGILDCPRFSLCLAGEAKYQVMRDGVLSVVTLRRGEAIVVAPNCVMEPHADGNYLALGVVFSGELTRFLLARKKRGEGKVAHRFLLAHHSRATMDEELRFFFEALERGGSRNVDDRYLCRLLQLVLIKARELMDQEPAAGTGVRRAHFTWRAACHYVQEHLAQGIGRADVAAFLRLHPNHVSRLFSEFSGGSFNAYLLKARLQRAQGLLRDPSMNVGQVARACGFAEANYFIRCYRKVFGVTPGRGRGRVIEVK
ncbi:helix-turn-helix transcriptional regulator [Phragmitibacter flavus]|nr:AraC family transcriptional regulator [Phragmitibacter flavus]